MKRTPPWVFVAAAGLQLAALGLCLWAMECIRRADEASAAPLPAPEPQPEPVAAETPPAAARPQPAPPEAPASTNGEAEPRPSTVTVRAVSFAELGEQGFAETSPPPRYFEPDPAARANEPEPLFGEAPRPKPPPAVVRVQPNSPTAPLFGPPPARPPHLPPEPSGVPHYIAELADATTQIVRGRVAGGGFAFGFYPDGNIRFVDVDGGRYAGKAESARARMREVDGTRAFTVQIGVAADGRLQASFTGGPHDAETIALEPHLGGSAA
jgi:hypothetical protein